MSLSDDGSNGCHRMIPAFLPCCESDLVTITAPALLMLARIQTDQTADLSALKALITAQTLKELPDYTKLLVDGSLAGWFHLIHHEDLLELDDVNILKSYQGRGLGSRILARIQELSAALGLPVICRVQSGNEGALRFYTRWGFRLLERTEKYSTLRWDPPQTDRSSP